MASSADSITAQQSSASSQPDLTLELALLFAEIAKPGDRRSAGKKLAALFHASEVFVFVKDEELNVTLPALGFPQTLPSISLWRRLVQDAEEAGTAVGLVATPEGEAASAFAISNGAVLIFCGVEEVQPVQPLRAYLALLDYVYRPERKMIALEGQLAVASNTAREVQSLATQLDAARKGLEQRVHERTAELRASIRELEGFTYSISHDLRSPLRAIVASARMLEEDFGPQLPVSAKGLLRKQAERAVTLGQLIDDLLQLSRVARSELSRSSIDLSGLADEVVAELRDTTFGSLTIEIQQGLTCSCDARLMRLVLQNLIENAVKFSSAGGKIVVGKSGGYFFVSDEGIGFENKYALKIFQPFERLVTTAEYPGTGIGLSNVQRIIERHGGKVWAESRPGHGTTFYFSVEPEISTLEAL